MHYATPSTVAEDERGISRGVGNVKGRGWVPLVGLNALVGSGVTLVFPLVLGRSVDSIVAGADRAHWLTAVVGLIALGIAASLIDVFKGASATHTRATHTRAADARVAAVTAIAAVAPAAGSLVLLALIDPALAAAFFGGILLMLAVRRAFGRVSLPDLNGVVTWRILSRSGGRTALACPMVAVLVVGGIQLGQITAGELFAAVQYAVLGAGLANLTRVLREIAPARAGAHRAVKPLPLRSISRHSDTAPALQRHRFVA